MAASTLMIHGFETYAKEKLFLVLQHGNENDCNPKSVRAALKLVKIMKRRFLKFARQQPRHARFYCHCSKVLQQLLNDLSTALNLYSSNKHEEAYTYVQWARIRPYDVRAKLKYLKC